MALRYSVVLGFLLASRADAMEVPGFPGVGLPGALSGAQALDAEQLLDAEVEEAAIALREASAALTKELSEMPKAGNLAPLGKVAGAGAIAGASAWPSAIPQIFDKASAIAGASKIADLKIDRSNAAEAVAKKSLRKTSAETELEKANAEKSLAKTQGLAKTGAEIVEPRPVETETESAKVTTKTDVRASKAQVLKVESKGRKVWPAEAAKAEPAEDPITKAEPAEAVEDSTKPTEEEKQKPSAMDSLYKTLQTGPEYGSEKAQKTTGEVADAQKDMKATSKDEKGVVGIAKQAVSNAWDAVAGTTKAHHEHHAETKKEKDASHVKIKEDVAKDLEDAHKKAKEHHEAHAEHHARTKKERDAEHVKIKKDMQKQMKDAADILPATDDHKHVK